MPTIDMAPRSRTQIHNCTRNILRSPQPLVRRIVRQLLRAALQLHQSVRHLRREEARRDRIAEDSLRAELDCQIASQV